MKNIRGLTPALSKGKGGRTPFIKGLGFEKLKILCILLTMIMVAALNLKAQIPQDEPVPFKNLKKYLKSIDTSLVKTGYLLNKGFLLSQQISEFDSMMNNPTANLIIVTNLQRWKVLYRGLNKAAIDSGKYLQPVDSIFSQTNEQRKKNTIIPLGFINFKGDLLPDSTLAQALNNKPVKLTKNKKMPFKTVNVFAIAPLQDEVGSGNIFFQLSSNYYFSNYKVKPKGVEIDLLDGSKPNYYPFRETKIPITYSCSCEKAIKFSLFTSTDTLICYSKIKISMPDNGRKPDKVYKISNGKLIDTSAIAGISLKSAPVSSESYNGDAYLFLGDENPTNKTKVFDKPVIFVEGFDPLNQYNNDGALGRYQYIFNALKSYGYDCMLLNFYDNGDKIENNANVVATLIKEINRIKAGNFETIIMGESMGGIVARVALKELENEGYNHQVRLLIPFDSPFRGANLPISLQYMINDIAQDWIVKDFNLGTDQLNQLKTMSNSPASQEMLLSNANRTTPTVQTDFVTYLDNLGWPMNLRKVALSCGSNNASQQQPANFIQGDGLINGSAFITTACTFSVDANTCLVNKLSGIEDVYIDVPVLWYLGSLVNYHGHHEDLIDRPYDICPGGYRTDVDKGIDAINSTLGSAGFFTMFNSASRPYIDFVPIISSIDLSPTISDLFYYNESNPARNKQILVSSHLTPLNDIYSQPSNAFHAWFDQNNPSDPIHKLVAKILSYEIMMDTMCLQNCTITNNKDFQTSTLLLTGYDVNPAQWGTKLIDKGNFVVNSGSNVTLTAGQRILFEPGTKIIQGATLKAKITAQSPSPSYPPSAFPTPIIDGPSGVCVYDPISYGLDNYGSIINNTYSCCWKVLNTSLVSNNFYFIFDADQLGIGLYNVQYTITRLADGATVSSTVSLQVGNYNCPCPNNQKKLNI